MLLLWCDMETGTFACWGVDRDCWRGNDGNISELMEEGGDTYTVVPSLKDTLWIGQKLLEASTGNACDAPCHQRSPS